MTMPGDLPRVRVLAVDDDPALLRALPLVLTEFDFCVAASATEAMSALAKAPVDAALVDYGLAPVNGIALLGEIARAHPQVRRYLVSGFHPSRFKEDVASGLILRTFLKPIDLPTLRAVLAGTVDDGSLPPSG